MTENETIEIIKKHCDGCEHNAGIECFARGEEEKCWEVKQKAIMSLRKVQEYESIGSVEECRLAKERLTPKKAIIGKVFFNNGLLSMPYMRWAVNAR